MTSFQMEETLPSNKGKRKKERICFLYSLGRFLGEILSVCLMPFSVPRVSSLMCFVWVCQGQIAMAVTLLRV